MIIKSLSRKTNSLKTIGNLVDYIGFNEQGFLLNTLATDRETVIKNFRENSLLLSKKKGCNYFYHEIISLAHHPGITQEEQKNILQDIAQQYTQERASKNIIFGNIHSDKDHLHLHLMISANALNSKKRTYFTKKRFNTIQREIETYLQQHYPQLNEPVLYNQEREKVKTKNKEQELKRRTKKSSRKEEIAHTVQEILESSQTKAELEKKLQEANLKHYYRGEVSQGIIDEQSGKRYRLKTLGLTSIFAKNISRLQTSVKIKQIKQQKKPPKAPPQAKKTRNLKVSKIVGALIFGGREMATNKQLEFAQKKGIKLSLAPTKTELKKKINKYVKKQQQSKQPTDRQKELAQKMGIEFSLSTSKQELGGLINVKIAELKAQQQAQEQERATLKEQKDLEKRKKPQNRQEVQELEALLKKKMPTKEKTPQFESIQEELDYFLKGRQVERKKEPERVPQAHRDTPKDSDRDKDELELERLLKRSKKDLGRDFDF